jgi:hypothetical protein
MSSLATPPPRTPEASSQKRNSFSSSKLPSSGTKNAALRPNSSNPSTSSRSNSKLLPQQQQQQAKKINNHQSSPSEKDVTGGENEQLTEQEKTELRVKKEAEEIMMQQQRIQRMNLLIGAMGENNSLERRRAEILRNVKLGGDGVDRTHSIEGEYILANQQQNNSNHTPVDRFREKMKQVVNESPEKMKKKIIMSPTTNDDDGDDFDDQVDDENNQYHHHHHHQNQRNEEANGQENLSRSIENMGNNIASLMAQLNNESYSTTPRKNQNQTSKNRNHHHHHHQDPISPSFYPGVTPFNSPNYQQQQQQYNNNNSNKNNINEDEEQEKQQLEYMNIGDDPMDPLRSSPARGAIELLRRDAMSDGGIMLPYNKMRLRSLARRSSPVLSRIPPFRQNDAALAAANVKEAHKQQKIVQDQIKVSAMVDVASAVLKRKEKEAVVGSQQRKEDRTQSKHKSLTEELAERAFRRKHGIPFDDVAPTTSEKRKKQQPAGVVAASPSSSLASSSTDPDARRRLLDEVEAAHDEEIERERNGKHRGNEEIDDGEEELTLEGEDEVDDEDNEDLLDGEQRQRRRQRLLLQAKTKNASSKNDKIEDQQRTGTTNTNTTTTTNTDVRGFSAVQGTTDPRLARAASTILLCAQVIRGFIAPTLASVVQQQQQQQSGSPNTLGTLDALRLAEQSVLHGVEASAIAVDNLLRDPSYQLESLHSVETMLENALKLHNSLNATASSRGTSEIYTSQNHNNNNYNNNFGGSPQQNSLSRRKNDEY